MEFHETAEILSSELVQMRLIMEVKKLGFYYVIEFFNLALFFIPEDRQKHYQTDVGRGIEKRKDIEVNR